ncbi:unnamed protein product [Calypogeia fissa]
MHGRLTGDEEWGRQGCCMFGRGGGDGGGSGLRWTRNCGNPGGQGRKENEYTWGGRLQFELKENEGCVIGKSWGLKGNGDGTAKKKGSKVIETGD